MDVTGPRGGTIRRTSVAPEGQRQARLPVDVVRDFSATQTLFHACVADLFGLSTTDYKCLDLVMRAQPQITAGVLASRSGLSTGAITGVLDRLEQAGYIRRTRDPADRRKVLIRTSDRLAERFEWIFGPLEETVRRMEDEFEARELRAIDRYLRRATDIFHEQILRLRQSPEAPEVG